MARSRSPGRSSRASDRSRSPSDSRSRSSSVGTNFHRRNRPPRPRSSRETLASTSSHRCYTSPQRKPAARLTPASATTGKTANGVHESHNRSRPVLSFPTLNLTDDKDGNLWKTLSKVAEPQGPYTHEVFFVITVHNGDIEPILPKEEFGPSFEEHATVIRSAAKN